MALHFTKQEFELREKKIIQSMKEKNIDALLLFRQESMYWLTGYDTFGYVFFQCLVLTSEGNKILLTRAADLRQAQNTSNIKDIRIWVDKDNNNPAEELKSILIKLNLENKNLGIEYESYGLTGKNAMMLNHSLNNFAKLHDESFLITKHRLVKSEQEIKYIRKAAELADKALEKAWHLSHPGANESDILSEMQGAIFSGGGDYPGNEFIIGSGPDALLCRYFSGRRTLDPVDQLTLEFAGVYRHYHSALMRTIPIGKAKREHLELYEICLEALNACESKLKVGSTAGDVFEQHRLVIDKTKYKSARLNACGYSLGATFAPNWMDWPMLYENNPILIDKNQVFFMHMILMHSETQTAMNLGETYIITETGCERLGKLKLDLVVG
jgi:Xaa-Pro dipeptidase